MQMGILLYKWKSKERTAMKLGARVRKDVTQYVELMDCLIDTLEDIVLL